MLVLNTVLFGHILLQAAGYGDFSFSDFFSSEFFIPLLVFLFLLYIVIKISRDAREKEHRYQHFFNLNTSAQEFYKTIEEFIQDMKEPHIKTSRTTYFEGGLTSGRREYLQIERAEFILTVCAAPFGKGFFVSWRQVDTSTIMQKIVLAIPRVGRALHAAIYSKTYYERDTAEMFKSFIEQVLLDAIEVLGKDTAIRGRPELGQKPVEQIQYQ